MHKLLLFVLFVIITNTQVFSADSTDSKEESFSQNLVKIATQGQDTEIPVPRDEYTSYHEQSLKVETVLKDFVLPIGIHILDVGCSDGEVTSKICLLTSAEMVVGIDDNKDKIMVARKNYADNNKLKFLEKNILDLLEERLYDACTCLATLHWVSEQNKSAAIQNISRSLKSGGYFITTFLIVSKKIRLNSAIHHVMVQEKWKDNFKEYSDPIHIVEPTYIKRLLHLCGFRVEKFDHDETTREFENSQTIHEWIMKWSAYGKYFKDKISHDEFWYEVIQAYRELTEQTSVDRLLLTEYNVRIFAMKT